MVYGDVMINLNLDIFIDFHKSKKADITIVTHPNDHPVDSDIIDVDENDRVIIFILNLIV